MRIHTIGTSLELLVFQDGTAVPVHDVDFVDVADTDLIIHLRSDLSRTVSTTWTNESEDARSFVDELIARGTLRLRSDVSVEEVASREANAAFAALSPEAKKSEWARRQKMSCT